MLQAAEPTSDEEQYNINSLLVPLKAILRRVRQIVNIFASLHNRPDSEIAMVYKTYIALMNVAYSNANILEKSPQFRALFTTAQKHMKNDCEMSINGAPSSGSPTSQSNANSISAGANIKAYLILPVQRIPRYELLLKQCLKLVSTLIASLSNTTSMSQSQPDTLKQPESTMHDEDLDKVTTIEGFTTHFRLTEDHLKTVIERIQSLCSMVNDASRRVANMEKMAEVQLKV